MYENAELCKKCGGLCCKRMPGSIFPKQLGKTKKQIEKKVLELLSTGNYALDWWEGDPTGKDEVPVGYFLRPRIKGINETIDPAWGGECIFLTLSGCKLTPNDRPLECQMLEPNEDGNCFKHRKNDKHKAAIRWLPYFKFFLNLIYSGEYF